MAAIKIHAGCAETADYAWVGKAGPPKYSTPWLLWAPINFYDVLFWPSDFLMNSLTQMGIHYVCKLGTIYKYPIQLDCSLFICKFCHFRLALFLLHFRLWIKNLSNTVKIEFLCFFRNKIYMKVLYIFFNRVLCSISHFIPRILNWFTTDWDVWHTT